MADSKYGRITVDGKEIPEDEPLFLIRGQDVTAPQAIRAYAWLLVERSGTLGVLGELFRVANEVEAWQRANPDRVKVPD